jgi:pyruvate kinase
MKSSQVQIVATIGPASEDPAILERLLQSGLGLARLNFSWSDFQTRERQIKNIRELGEKYSRHIPIIQDLSGPRVQGETGHTYNHAAVQALTEEDRLAIHFGAGQKLEYAAVSFVGGPEDILTCRKIILEAGGSQRVIAKIERKVALDHLDEIIKVSDAIMVARGDLGQEIPLEEVPFVQEEIIKKCKAAGKPVIVATEMLLSMTEKSLPTRAEVTDVATAVIEGADAVMLSEESARGKYPVEAVHMMSRIIFAAERHLDGRITINPL